MLLLLIVGILDGIAPLSEVVVAEWPRPLNSRVPSERMPEVLPLSSGYG